MAVFPTVEAILLKAHQSLGIKGHQTSDKRKLLNRKKRSDKHAERIDELIDDIFSSLGLAEDEVRDLRANLLELAAFLSAVELRVWTRGASDRQVLWIILAYILAPGLGRKVAIWDQYSRLDPGMPGGQFWFLPRRSKSGTAGLSLPVQNVMAWLIDILGLSLEQLERSLAMDKHEPGTVKATLRNWRSGKTTPDPEVIEEYFREGLLLEFKGAYSCESPARDLETEFHRAIEFVRLRGLTPDVLREQVPMTAPGRLESLMAGEGGEAEKEAFVECLKARYAAPSLRTIRQRLLVARAMQDGYLRLVGALCPEVNAKKCENLRENKVLQIQSIFERSYNLTIKSYSCASSAEEEYEIFRGALSDIEQLTTFLSVMTHHEHHALGLVVDLVNQRFQDADPDGQLENVVGYDRDSLLEVIGREIGRIKEEQNTLDEILKIKKAISRETYKRLVIGINSWDVACAIAGSAELPPFVRLLAGDRSRELASSPHQAMMSSLFLAAFVLNGGRRNRIPGCELFVENLLVDASSNPWAAHYAAMIDQLRAKHHLSRNQIDLAKSLFRKSLKACKRQSCGTLRGEVARDLFTVEVGLGKLIPGNHEGYWQDMMLFGLFQAGEVSLQAAAKWAANYFWEDLYAPYDGYPPLQRNTH
jgi:hypothetical protein